MADESVYAERLLAGVIARVFWGVLGLGRRGARMRCLLIREMEKQVLFME